MDPSLLPTVIQAAPQYALAGYMIYLLTRVMGHASTDRGDYRADLESAEQRHSAELLRLRESYEADLARLRASYEADLASVRAALGDVREQLAGVTSQLDTERRARWHAEDVAAQARRIAEGVAATTDPTDQEV